MENTTVETPKTLDQYSVEELKKLIADKEEEERKEKERKRKLYEDRKYKLVDYLLEDAKEVQTEVKDFKQTCFNLLREFYESMKQYGDVAEANKGNFSIKNANGDKKVEFCRQVISSFDERANIAEIKLKEFLLDFVKKKDQPIYELVMSLLERNSVTGDFDSRNIQKLYKIEDKFTDPRWKEAISLFKESFQESGTNFYVRFYEMDSTGKWQTIQLNFSAIDVK